MEFTYQEFSVHQRLSSTLLQQTATSVSVDFSTLVDARSDTSGSHRSGGKARSDRHHNPMTPTGRSRVPTGSLSNKAFGQHVEAVGLLATEAIPSSYGKAPRHSANRPKATFSAGAPYNKKLAKKGFQAPPPSMSSSLRQQLRQRGDMTPLRLSPQPSPRLLPQIDLLPASVAFEEQLCGMLEETSCE